MVNEHIVKSYDKDLKFLNDKILLMGEEVLIQIENTLQALRENNQSLAHNVIDRDPIIDALEYEIDNYAVRILALRHPVAEDLRIVIAALKISTHLERIADYARNIAKKCIAIQDHVHHGISLRPLEEMARNVQEMIAKILKAYTDRDIQLAKAIWHQDEVVDEVYVSYIRELLTHMMENPKIISPCIHLMFIAKNLERAGDHITNIAEVIIYLISGEIFQEQR